MAESPSSLTWLLEHGLASLAAPLETLTSAQSRLYWGYLAAALVIAATVYVVRETRAAPFSWRGLARFVWPKSVWLHPSSILDYKFVVIDLVLFTLALGPFVVSSYAVADGVGAGLRVMFGAPDSAQSAGFVLIALFTVSLVVVADLIRFLCHALMHHVPMLWEFHKVHHSAKALTPATLFRAHPLEKFLMASATGIAFGLVLGVFEYVAPQDLTMLTVLGVNVVLFAFFSWANLSHSHVWLSFGRRAEHVILSPAQHQVHHSDAPQHRHKNLGSIFALWDWAFGTLYIPPAQERLSFGLGSKEDEAFSSVWRIYTYPLRRALRQAAYGGAMITEDQYRDKRAQTSDAL